MGRPDTDDAGRWRVGPSGGCFQVTPRRLQPTRRTLDLLPVGLYPPFLTPNWNPSLASQVIPGRMSIGYCAQVGNFPCPARSPACPHAFPRVAN